MRPVSRAPFPRGAGSKQSSCTTFLIDWKTSALYPPPFVLSLVGIFPHSYSSDLKVSRINRLLDQQTAFMRLYPMRSILSWNKKNAKDRTQIYSWVADEENKNENAPRMLAKKLGLQRALALARQLRTNHDRSAHPLKGWLKTHEEFQTLYANEKTSAIAFLKAIRSYTDKESGFSPKLEELVKESIIALDRQLAIVATTTPQDNRRSDLPEFTIEPWSDFEQEDSDMKDLRTALEENDESSEERGRTRLHSRDRTGKGGDPKMGPLNNSGRPLVAAHTYTIKRLAPAARWAQQHDGRYHKLVNVINKAPYGNEVEENMPKGRGAQGLNKNKGVLEMTAGSRISHEAGI
ncbi:hypothetical protein IWX50DRAFT_618880 [Phyllosticta citricarpa]